MKKTKKKIEKFLSDIQWFFHLNSIDKEIVYKKEDNRGILASIDYEEKYQRCTINIYPAFFKDSPKEQVNTLLHEMTHVLIEPLLKEAYKPLNDEFTNVALIKHQSERVTSSVTERFINLIEAGGFVKRAYNDYLKK